MVDPTLDGPIAASLNTGRPLISLPSLPIRLPVPLSGPSEALPGPAAQPRRRRLFDGSSGDSRTHRSQPGAVACREISPGVQIASSSSHVALHPPFAPTTTAETSPAIVTPLNIPSQSVSEPHQPQRQLSQQVSDAVASQDWQEPTSSDATNPTLHNT